MKQWLAILALLWLTVTFGNAGERHSLPSRTELRAAVVNQDNGEQVCADDSPLLATPGAARTTHLSGAASDTGKGGRQTHTQSAVPDKGFAWNGHSHQPDTGIGPQYGICTPSTRDTQRYIYFLKRIII